ncbi:MAG: 6-hydroxycyclohex-1-ene-1-carbonyl-CoA dehydrogenase [Candidatus Krumholzibacteria bacterium]|jgi:6-hydroxycyclohex-1-ene-1-carbonyl-CoA dehydrogenase|nr:6-hydroxycyclohex-1-ene-1-carbonyl-CoA dehydrogenase [Candidatus Krumholzibacteria bacterium]MDP6668440.1 6-hydroxycyclohex-1-ene-1-carbonyl-CoA dehydrogenase [Candidatus Krumholzibacteria bacterium]MDP6797261.1 6-hydroxycyclohex-1-ene-1-carbonyl-CoA dehydrogenase [Candidatus Krumholzibacteria bacterium]MDP7021836.1 6-hydroxycyclohex-1-ene-1-carbonyl-CoA dehydrogenase [Candidatus Krumholzibacteria bacterium]
MSIDARAWYMVAPGEPCEERALNLSSCPPGEATVQVAGCGVCHTDISFLYHNVPTRGELPLALGHEISGTVIEVGEGVDESLLHRPVLIPAVLPCGTCELCRSGRRRICRNQVMPGNDRQGGFASHIQVPALYLCPVEDALLKKHELWELSVVADAISTPFQAVKNSGLKAGELAIVIGAGGIGIHAVQVAAACGALVIALDIDADKLETALAHGASGGIDVSGLSSKEIRAAVKEKAKTLHAPPYCWKILETSGSGPGQETALALLGFGAWLGIVGFTMKKLEFMPSKLMAFDATIEGNWGSDPTIYPEVLEWLRDGRLKVSPFVERHPLEDLNPVLQAARDGKLQKRAVMTP